MVPWWLKVLVLWHVFCICVWACPNPGDALMDGKVKPAPLALGDWLRIFDAKTLKNLQVVKITLLTTGTWQYWDMFAPNPADTDQYGDSLVHFKDGTTKLYKYPRMFELGIPEKYLKERFRKFYERAHDNEHASYMFMPFVYREALDCYTAPGNPPIKIELRVYSKTVSQPGTPEAKNYKQVLYFVSEIDPVELNRLAKLDRGTG